MIPKYWKTYYTEGELAVGEYNEEKKILKLTLDIDYHPLGCLFLLGYFLGIASLLISSDNIKIEQTKFMYKGDKYQEFTITW